MATVAVTTTPATLDAGGSEFVTVTNTGTTDVTVARGSQSFVLRPTQARVVYPEGSAVTASVVSGTGQVSTAAQAAQVTQAQQLAANTAAIAGLPGTYGRKSTAAIDLNLAPYNATPGADVTSALQAALDYVAANSVNGGDIYFSVPGTYLVNGASQTGTAQGYSYAGQVLIPAVPLATSRPIRIRGLFPTSGGGQTTGAPNGTILLSNATSGYVFDIKPSFTEFGCPWTGVMPIFEDIVIRTSDNPTCGGLNLTCTQRARLSRVQIDTPTSFVAPTSGSLAGLVMPQVYNNGDVTVRDTTIRGYPIGIITSEHGVFDNVDVAYCMTAFKGNGRSHPNWFGYVDVEECPTVFDGGSAPAFGAPAVSAGIAVYGAIDFENVNRSGLAPVAFVNDSATNPVGGKLDVMGTISGTFPTIGGRYLDLVPIGRTPSQGPGQLGLGWRELHPYDNFTREVALSGAGAPGQCSPTLHPWRVESGSFSVASNALKGLTGTDRCFVPVRAAANFSISQGSAPARTITCKFTLGNTSPTLRVYACAPWSGTGAANNGTTAIEVKLSGGSSPILRANNSNLVSGGSSLVAGSTHTVQLAVYHNAVGYPYAVKVYLDGALIIASGVNSTLGGGNPSAWPFYEDGLSFGDTGTSVSLFAVQDITPDVPFVKSGTATLAAGTVTVSDSLITASSVIRYFRTTAGGTLGDLSLALTAGSGFTLTSTSNTETSAIYYEVVSY